MDSTWERQQTNHCSWAARKPGRANPQSSSNHGGQKPRGQRCKPLPRSAVELVSFPFSTTVSTLKQRRQLNLSFLNSGTTRTARALSTVSEKLKMPRTAKCDSSLPDLLSWSHILLQERDGQRGQRGGVVCMLQECTRVSDQDTYDKLARSPPRDTNWPQRWQKGSAPEQIQRQANEKLEMVGKLQVRSLVGSERKHLLERLSPEHTCSRNMSMSPPTWTPNQRQVPSSAPKQDSNERGRDPTPPHPPNHPSEPESPGVKGRQCRAKSSRVTPVSNQPLSATGLKVP